MPPDDSWFDNLLFELQLLGSTMRSLNIQQSVIDDINRTIRSSADTLDTPVDGVDTGPLAGSDGGQVFGHNADLARQHLTKALRDMRTGLEEHDESVREYQRRQEENDESSAATLMGLTGGIRRADECMTGPAQGNTSACGPGGGH